MNFLHLHNLYFSSHLLLFCISSFLSISSISFRFPKTFHLRFFLPLEPSSLHLTLIHIHVYSWDAFHSLTASYFSSIPHFLPGFLCFTLLSFTSASILPASVPPSLLSPFLPPCPHSYFAFIPIIFLLFLASLRFLLPYFNPFPFPFLLPSFTLLALFILILVLFHLLPGFSCLTEPLSVLCLTSTSSFHPCFSMQLLTPPTPPHPSLPVPGHHKASRDRDTNSLKRTKSPETYLWVLPVHKPI